LGVLPGTGGLTRLTDKRKIRRDRADLFCAAEEGARGGRALDWRLVDELVPPTAWVEKVHERALAMAAMSDRPKDTKGIALPPLERRTIGDATVYRNVRVDLDRNRRLANITISGPAQADIPGELAGIHARGADFWPLAMARELDDAILNLRFNEPEFGIIVLRSEGDQSAVIAADILLDQCADDWLAREIRLLLRRVFKRIDVTSRSLFTLVEQGSCFAGFLAELVFAADRAFMFAGTRAGDNRGAPMLVLSSANFGALPMGNGLTRLATRFLGERQALERAEQAICTPVLAEEGEKLGLVTAIYDEVDWDEEVRLQLEERASFSPDALTGLEANLRFAGPETMETKIFARLTAWQNWIFQRPNAVGEAGALKRYGTGQRPQFDPERV
jgi:benzoyl-CoA-dihydrodiol lyase